MSDQEEMQVVEQGLAYFNTQVLPRVEGLTKEQKKEMYAKLLELTRLATGCTECSSDDALATIYALLSLLPQALVAGEGTLEDKANKLKVLAVVVYSMAVDFLNKTIQVAEELVAQGGG